MALKADRREGMQDIRCYVNSVHERGGIISMVTPTGSGGYPGNPKNTAAYAASPSGAKPLGLLLHDVVLIDTNRQHENFYKGGFQARVGQKVAIDPRGRYTTNMIPSGVSPNGGDTAYLAASGLISNVQAPGAPAVGTWLTSKDQDGYAFISLNVI
jgi:hypothetical protein